jgi:hypothetical protein
MGLKPSRTVCLLAGCLVVTLLAMLVGGCASPAPTATPQSPVSVTPTPVPAATPVTAATPSPVATPTLTPTPSPTPAPGNIVQAYQWLYNGKLYQFQLSIPEPAVFHYRGLPHGEGSDYAAYALSSLDRPYLPIITLKGAVQSEGFGEYDAAMLVQSFVQSLQNTPGRDDNPKYPVETLLDRGGDSEDTSLLAAALLNDLGYDAVLLRFPGHVAVGVKGTGDLYGRYYNYKGVSYYYLETAIPGYAFGAIPEEYRNVSATIIPMSDATLVTVSATVEQTSEEALYVHYKVRCDVWNTGTSTAKNVSVYFAALALIYGPDQTWDHADVTVGDIEAGGSRPVEAELRIPRSGDTQVQCIASGDNFDAVVWKGEQFTL